MQTPSAYVGDPQKTAIPEADGEADGVVAADALGENAVRHNPLKSKAADGVVAADGDLANCPSSPDPIRPTTPASPATGNGPVNQDDRSEPPPDDDGIKREPVGRSYEQLKI